MREAVSLPKKVRQCFVLRTQISLQKLIFFTKSVDTQSSQCYHRTVHRTCTKGDLMYFSSSLIVIGIISVLLVVRLVEGDVLL